MNEATRKLLLEIRHDAEQGSTDPQLVRKIDEVLLLEDPLSSLSFHRFATINMTRCRRWHDPMGWSPQMWGLAMCGEAGECANALKKLWRHDEGTHAESQSPDRDVLVKNVAMEIGDVVVYADLLAQRMGLRLEGCVRDTFNRISVRENFPERL